MNLAEVHACHHLAAGRRAGGKTIDYAAKM
jgi:hypothetical protein